MNNETLSGEFVNLVDELSFNELFGKKLSGKVKSVAAAAALYIASMGGVTRIANAQELSQNKIDISYAPENQGPKIDRDVVMFSVGGKTLLKGDTSSRDQAIIDAVGSNYSRVILPKNGAPSGVMVDPVNGFVAYAPKYLDYGEVGRIDYVTESGGNVIYVDKKTGNRYGFSTVFQVPHDNGGQEFVPIAVFLAESPNGGFKVGFIDTDSEVRFSNDNIDHTAVLLGKKGKIDPRTNTLTGDGKSFEWANGEWVGGKEIKKNTWSQEKIDNAINKAKKFSNLPFGIVTNLEVPNEYQPKTISGVPLEMPKPYVYNKDPSIKLFTFNFATVIDGKNVALKVLTGPNARVQWVDNDFSFALNSRGYSISELMNPVYLGTDFTFKQMALVIYPVKESVGEVTDLQTIKEINVVNDIRYKIISGELGSSVVGPAVDFYLMRDN